MRNFEQIDGYIREARLQRSAYLGNLIGEWLGDTWLAAVRLGKAVLTEGPSRPAPVQARTSSPAHSH